VPAACIWAQLVDQQLVDQFYEDDILQHKSIQGFIQILKHQWKTFKDSKFNRLTKALKLFKYFNGHYPCIEALKLVKYRTFAEKFANDEDFMQILTDIIIHKFGRDVLNFLFTWSQHKNVRNIFYQNYTKISMKNILKRISSMLNQETKLFQTMDFSFRKNDYHKLDISLQYEDLAMRIIDEGSDDIVSIFCRLFTHTNLMTKIYYDMGTKLLFELSSYRV